jgi:hypothetical protein
MPRQRINESPALRRARGVWHDAALDARREIRARGLPVSRWLDDQAGRRRGDRVVAGLARLSEELADAGVPVEQIARAVSAATMQIVTAALSAPSQDPPRAA